MSFLTTVLCREANCPDGDELLQRSLLRTSCVLIFKGKMIFLVKENKDMYEILRKVHGNINTILFGLINLQTVFRDTRSFVRLYKSSTDMITI
jgi:hypothetical protein